ncbi:MAG: hypothetical protein HZA79_00640 [Sphingobacteriales bacterium]|nr:hypothetical protein [Sphingobacteriales bacterium]
MQAKYRVFITPLIILFILCLLVFRTSGSTDTRTDPGKECCKKAESPCSDKEKNRSEDLMMENLSRQFISFMPIN